MTQVKAATPYYQEIFDKIENSGFQPHQKKLVRNVALQAESLEVNLENHIKRVFMTRFARDYALYHPLEIAIPLPKSYPPLPFNVNNNDEVRKFLSDPKRIRAYNDVLKKWEQNPDGKRYVNYIKVEGNPMHVGHAAPKPEEITKNADPNMRIRNYFIGNYQLVRHAWDFAKQNGLENELFKEMLTLGGCLDGLGNRLQNWLHQKEYVLQQQKKKQKIDFVKYDEVATNVIKHFDGGELDGDVEFEEADLPLAKKMWEYANEGMTINNKPLDMPEFFRVVLNIVMVDDAQRKIQKIIDYIQPTKASHKAAPQPKAVPQVKAAPEPKAVPQVKAAPQPKAAPQVKAVPQPKAVPQVKAAPQLKAVPQIKAAPQPKAVPQVKAAPQPKAVPQVKSAPQVKAVPHKVLPQQAPQVKAKDTPPKWQQKSQQSVHNVRAATKTADLKGKGVVEKKQETPKDNKKVINIDAKSIKSIKEELDNIKIQKLYDDAESKKSITSRYLKAQHRDRPKQIDFLQSEIIKASNALGLLRGEWAKLPDDKKNDRLKDVLNQLDKAVNTVEAQMQKAGHNFKGSSRMENVNQHLRDLTQQMRKTAQIDSVENNAKKKPDKK